MAEADVSTVDERYQQGLRLARQGSFFEAHEEFELAWRNCDASERDFFQGLVHVVVSAYQRGRGRPVAAESQRQKALRRLAAFEPAHRRLDVAHLRARLERAEADPREDLIERDLQPPVAPEEEQQPEGDERHA
jgi:predicted metal-dependent hydrolase